MKRGWNYLFVSCVFSVKVHEAEFSIQARKLSSLRACEVNRYGCRNFPCSCFPDLILLMAYGALCRTQPVRGCTSLPGAQATVWVC